MNPFSAKNRAEAEQAETEREYRLGIRTHPLTVAEQRELSLLFKRSCQGGPWGQDYGLAPMDDVARARLAELQATKNKGGTEDDRL